MNNQKLILSILGLVVLFGLGYVLVSSNDKEVANMPINNGNNNVDNPPQFPYIDASFGSPVVLKAGQDAMFSDGLYVTLKEINNSRCPDDPRIECMWQGEISGLFDVSGGKIKSKAELALGPPNYKTQSIDGYTITLVSATEKSITITVIYEKGPVNSGGCFIGGCSGQICSDQQDVISTCEYKEEYACYKTARCERQTTGQCGWTPSTELNACLNAN